MDPHTAIANILGTTDLQEQARRVGDLTLRDALAILATFLRGSQTDSEFGAHLGAIVDAVGKLKWLVGSDPFPQMPK